MLCPSCHSEMSRFERASVVLDRCETCKAVWFDHHELDVYRHSGAREDLATPDAGPTEDALVCPRCQTFLEAALLEGVRVDRCPDCAGLYVDRDDLDRLRGLTGLRILDGLVA